MIEMEHGIRLLSKAYDVIEMYAPNHPLRGEIDAYFEMQPDAVLEAVLREPPQGDYRKARGALKREAGESENNGK